MTQGIRAIAPADDTPCVLVRSDLRPSTWQILSRYAKEHHVDIGLVLSRIADQAVARPRGRRKSSMDGVDDRIRELNAAKWSDNRIAAKLGIAQSTVSRRRAHMGLLPPKPRAGGRKRAA